MVQNRQIQQSIGKTHTYAFILPLIIKLGILLAFVYGLSILVSPAVVTITILFIGVVVFFEIASFVLKIALSIISALFILALVGIVLAAIF